MCLLPVGNPLANRCSFLDPNCRHRRRVQGMSRSQIQMMCPILYSANNDRTGSTLGHLLNASGPPWVQLAVTQENVRSSANISTHKHHFFPVWSGLHLIPFPTALIVLSLVWFVWRLKIGNAIGWHLYTGVDD